MKFVLFYLLTFVIARENSVVAAGDFSQEDLQFIAGRLYPAECSQLLSYFPGSRGASKNSQKDHRQSSDDWATENSRVQCLESLIECNEKGRKGGCTKIWLEGALHKLGRVDLVSRLKKRWKKNSKSSQKKSRRKSKTRGIIRSHDGRHKSRKRIVTPNRRDTKSPDGRSSDDDLFGQRFIIFVVVVSVLIIVFLGCIMIVSYRRACRCYNNYLKDHDFKDRKRPNEESFDRQFSTSEFRRLTDSQAQNYSQNKDECTKLVGESDNTQIYGPTWSEEFPSARNNRKLESLDEATEIINEEGCKCSPVMEKSYTRNMSPCARLKRFFDSPRRLLRGSEDTGKKCRKKVAEGRKKRKSRRDDSAAEGNDDRRAKRGRRKSGKSRGTREKRANRERRARMIRSNCKNVEGQKPVGCTCEMCKLFSVNDATECSEKGKIARR